MLGLLLFLVYINELCEILEKSNIFLNVYDTVLVTSAPGYIIAHIETCNMTLTILQTGV